MRTYLDCTPCLAHQAHEAVCRATDDSAVRERILRRVFTEISEMAFNAPPPVMGQRIHEIVREEVGDPDAYREDKEASNQLALRLAQELEPAVNASADPFAAALALAIAANVIDLGAKGHHDVTEESVAEEMRAALGKALNPGAVEGLRAAAAKADEVLYLCDNAGEIVFDRLLVERLPCPCVTVAVRGRPVINDAVRSDAEAVRMADVAEIIDNGDAAPGTILDRCSEEFRARFREADVVISKGQGNYETLSAEDRPHLFFLLRVKCPTVAADLGCEVGELVIARA